MPKLSDFIDALDTGKDKRKISYSRTLKSYKTTIHPQHLFIQDCFFYHES